jgi:hypothetical protein
MSVRDGYGPIVSVGVTAQFAFVLVVEPPVDVDDGLVGESPQATADGGRGRSNRAERRSPAELSYLHRSFVTHVRPHL